MENGKQIAKQFDKASLLKIGKGTLIAASGAVGLYILKWLGTLNFGDMTPIVGAIIPILVNAIHQYYKGV